MMYNLLIPCVFFKVMQNFSQRYKINKTKKLRRSVILKTRATLISRPINIKRYLAIIHCKCTVIIAYNSNVIIPTLLHKEKRRNKIISQLIEIICHSDTTSFCSQSKIIIISRLGLTLLSVFLFALEIATSCEYLGN